MSFKVPHIALDPNNSKLRDYVLDWAVPNLGKCHDVTDLLPVIEGVISTNRDDLQASLNKQLSLARISMQKIIEISMNRPSHLSASIQ